MAECVNTISAFLAGCSANIRSGLSEQDVYMISYADTEKVTGSTDNYSISAGVINEVGVKASASFVNVGVAKGSAGFKQTISRQDNGIVDKTLEFTSQLLGVTKESGEFVESLIGNPIMLLTKGKNGVWYLFGVSGTLELSNAEADISTGNNQYSLTFDGEQGAETSFIVDPTYILTLLA